MVAVTRSFSDKLAKRLGADPDFVFSFLSQWQPYEGGGAANNPLNTTQPHPRSIEPWNDLGGGIGVQQYADEDAGVEATYQTIVNGYYPNLAQGLRSGAIDAAAVAPEIRTWGTIHFADALAGGTATIGTSALPGSSPAERAATNKEIQSLREQYTTMLAEYERDPNGNYTLADIQDMAALINDRQKSLDDIEATGYGRQQDAFANSIALGDYQAKQADRAWQRYLENRRSAETAAQVEIDRRAKHNLAQGDIEAARQANFGQGPQASTKTYLPANYGDLLDEYSKKFGADTPPSSDPSTYGGPALPGQSGTTGGGYEEPFVPVGGDGLPISGPGSALTPTMTSPPRGIREAGNDVYEGVVRKLQMRGEPSEMATPRQGGTGFFITDNIKQNLIDPFGMPKDLGQLLGGSDRKILGMKMGQGNAPGRAVDKRIKKWWQQGRKVVGFANGTMNAPGGPARVGEKGPETMIDPRTGQPMIVGELGPEVREVPQGAAVYPTDIPPDEAYAHYQMQQMASQQNPRSVNMAEAQARASDPQLQQKVMAALQDAVIARTVSNPPPTPGLAGVWTKPDPWADWRAVNDPLGQGVA